MAFELPKEAFIALAALGWADGLPPGGRPERFDVVVLDKRLREKVPHLAPKE